jgi:hypothetical protein
MVRSWLAFAHLRAVCLLFDSMIESKDRRSFACCINYITYVAVLVDLEEYGVMSGKQSHDVANLVGSFTCKLWYCLFI